MSSETQTNQQKTEDYAFIQLFLISHFVWFDDLKNLF